jgi:hypothetical protein
MGKVELAEVGSADGTTENRSIISYLLQTAFKR